MIREMRPQDWAETAEIYRQGIERGNATFTRECPSYEEWDRAHIKECRLVYEAEGHVAGFAAIAPTSSREPYRGVAEVSIYVDGAYQRRGIGEALLKKLCEESEKCGYWSLYSAVFSVNEASIALHKKCGFRVTGYREDIAKDIFGNWQSTTVMERRNAIR